MSITQRLQSSKPLVLDGALGTLLPQTSQEHPLWSTHTVITSPQLIQQIHESYIERGARLIQTSTYQTSEGNIQKYFPDEDYSQVVQKSVDLATAAKNGRTDVFIAGSIGPYGASLANGAEYTGEYQGITDAGLVAFHEKRLDIMCQDPNVDIIGLETIPNLQEIKVLTKMMNARQKPYYLALSVKGETLADGTPLSEFSKEILQGERLLCVGVNCLGLTDSLQWLQRLAPLNKPLIVYPNSGEIYEGREWHEGKAEDHITWKEYVQRCKEQGNVVIIGGCCRTTPDSIGEVTQAVDDLYN